MLILKLLRIECAKSAQCAPLKHHYDECVERVTEQHEDPNHKGPKENCVEECELCLLLSPDCATFPVGRYLCSWPMYILQDSDHDVEADGRCVCLQSSTYHIARRSVRLRNCSESSSRGSPAYAESCAYGMVEGWNRDWARGSNTYRLYRSLQVRIVHTVDEGVYFSVYSIVESVLGFAIATVLLDLHRGRGREERQ